MKKSGANFFSSDFLPIRRIEIDEKLERVGAALNI